MDILAWNAVAIQTETKKPNGDLLGNGLIIFIKIR
jgi:hypothetical protein